MDAKRQPSSPDSSSAEPKGGSSAQAVVELLQTGEGGVVLWSRQRLEIASELQLRLKSVLLGRRAAGSGHPWSVVRGFVVQCRPARRGDGSVGFEVTVVFREALSKPAILAASVRRFRPVPGCGENPLGLN